MDNKNQSWDDRLTEHAQNKFDNYLRRRFDLGQARSNELVYICGEYIYVEKASSGAYAQIRLDKDNNEPLDLLRGVKIKTVFTKFYLTNEAQAGGWLDLLIAINFEYEKPGQTESLSQAQAAVTQTCTLADTNYNLAAQITKIVTIKADPENLGIVWVDFGQAAVQNSCLALDPGDHHTDIVLNLNRLNFNAEVAGDVVHVVPNY